MKNVGHKTHSLENLTKLFGKDKKFIIHYTCNPPAANILSEKGIIPVGEKYGCANNREVLIINKELVEENTGKKIPDNCDPNLLVIYCEQALRNISKQKNLLN